MKTRLLAAAAALLLTTPLLAGSALSAMKAQPQNGAPKNGFRAEFLHDFDDVSKKIVELAEAIPAAKYNWRPAAGVRSVSEVYMHIAGGNYFLATFAGAKPP